LILVNVLPQWQLSGESLHPKRRGVPLRAPIPSPKTKAGSCAADSCHCRRELALDFGRTALSVCTVPSRGADSGPSQAIFGICSAVRRAVLSRCRAPGASGILATLSCFRARATARLSFTASDAVLCSLRKRVLSESVKQADTWRACLCCRSRTQVRAANERRLWRLRILSEISFGRGFVRL
jgi:hypothetical protein